MSETETMDREAEIYVFDFDGTISTKDSFVEYIKFTRGPMVLYFGVLIFAPLLIAMRLGLANRGKTKEKILSWYLKGKPKAWLDEQSETFLAKSMNGIIRSKAVEEIKKLQAAGHEIAVVSASVDIWLSAFCKKHGLRLICTKADFVNAIFSGKFASPNCRKEQKVERRRLSWTANCHMLHTECRIYQTYRAPHVLLVYTRISLEYYSVIQLNSQKECRAND